MSHFSSKTFIRLSLKEINSNNIVLKLEEILFRNTETLTL